VLRKRLETHRIEAVGVIGEKSLHAAFSETGTVESRPAARCELKQILSMASPAILAANAVEAGQQQALKPGQDWPGHHRCGIERFAAGWAASAGCARRRAGPRNYTRFTGASNSPAQGAS